MNKTSFTARIQAIGAQLWRAVRHVVFHNGWVKLIAVVISLVLWAGLISQDNSLTRDKTWQNVNVSVINADTMKRNSYIIVSDLDALLSNVSVTAAIPQKQYDTAETSAYNLRVDLSRINGTGNQELRILSTASSTYGKVINTVPSAVNVQVEEYFVRQRIPVSVSVTGEYQNGWYKDWYISGLSANPELIAVNGPRTLVQTISRAKVLIDPESLEWAEGPLMTTGEITLCNRAGEEVSSPFLGVTTESLSIDSVLIEANILPTRSFRIEEQGDFQGGLPEGYRIASVKNSPEVIRIAARSEALEKLEDLPLDPAGINLQNLEEGTNVITIKVQKPSEDAVLSNDTVIVTVDVEKDE